MTPLDPGKTVRLRNLRPGRPEIWSATSAAGTWTYTREESEGTPWVVLHTPTGRWTLYQSLPTARKATANGLAERHEQEAAA